MEVEAAKRSLTGALPSRNGRRRGPSQTGMAQRLRPVQHAETSRRTPHSEATVRPPTVRHACGPGPHSGSSPKPGLLTPRHTCIPSRLQ
eukprot:6385345-Pyramimonas_sp.AAC.1